ncbi:MAG: hypothetical protein K2H53_00985 [Clostridia bacterium]|nr:hypothetical protein [Clostridia bacterium]
MDILMRNKTNLEGKTVKVKFADGLFKTNHHGTKLVRVFVSYSEDSDSLSNLDLQFDGRCGLLKDNTGITWEFFSEDCTPLIAEIVVDMFTYQELVDYIEGLPS